jgi:transcriptional regulator
MMYVPAPFGVSDQGILDAFIRRYAFATLVTLSSGGLVASHIPIMLRRSERGGSLIGHLARANDHWRALDGRHDSLAIFHGPHGYVSPTWYVTSPAVPTWNYAVVHVCGKPRVSTDPNFTRTALTDLIAEYEGARARPWGAADMASDVFDKLARAIVAFEMPIETVQGKFKLGQNRSREDRSGMLAGLESEGTSDANLLAKFIREHLGE